MNSMRESALKWRREERDMKHMNIETLMDILDWFDDGLYDYLDHILLTKPDGEARICRAMADAALGLERCLPKNCLYQHNT